MISCVELLIAGLLAAPVPATVEAHVRDGLAERWRVEATRLDLAWGRTDAALREDTEVALSGAGREGWVAVTLTAPGRAPQVVRVRAGVKQRVSVAAHDLVSGTRVTADDIAWQERTVWGPPQDGRPGPGEVETGWLVRRALGAGEPLAWPAVAPPLAVEAGTPVTLVWSQGGVRVSRPGIAVNGAAKGGWVQVRVDGRADRFVGQAIGAGEVRLPGGMR
jgi:flagella basal body P-ring formation protein FlgA